MPRFVPKYAIIHVAYFDGSVETAVEAAKIAGAHGSLAFPDGRPLLLVAGSEVIAPAWVAQDGWFSADIFDQNYECIDGLRLVSSGFTPSPILKPSDGSTAPAGISEGDFIIDKAEPDPKRAGEPLEVLEIRDGKLLCDWAWGEKVVALADAEIYTGPSDEQ